MKKRVTLLTYHVWRSDRKAGFHHLAKAYRDMGYEVLFMTVGLSLISKLQNDFRLRCSEKNELNRLIIEEQGIYSYQHFTPWHSVGIKRKLPDLILKPFARAYHLFPFQDAEEFICSSDLIIFESTDGLLLFDKIKKMAPHARLVYRMSDLLETLRKNPYHFEYERLILPLFNSVSVPARHTKPILESLTNLSIDFHGIDKEAFDSISENPYEQLPAEPNGVMMKNAVFVGSEWRFDYKVFEKFAELFPDIHFHMIGNLKEKIQSGNVTYYGEMPFRQAASYIKFADIGLIPFQKQNFIRFFGDSSLKVLQYAYCLLPTLIPDYMETGWPHTVTYAPNDTASIKIAVEKALTMKIDESLKGSLSTWKELAEKLTVNPTCSK